jgi:hypothetical protein
MQQLNKGCGNEIYFDANNKSQSGKFIPLSRETGLKSLQNKLIDMTSYRNG